MNLRPLADRVIVQRIEGEQRTPGGIIIPDTIQEKPSEGKVIATGPGERDDNGNIRPMDVKKGDTVLFNKFSGIEITIDRDEVVILRESEILGILD